MEIEPEAGDPLQVDAEVTLPDPWTHPPANQPAYVTLGTTPTPPQEEDEDFQEVCVEREPRLALAKNLRRRRHPCGCGGSHGTTRGCGRAGTEKPAAGMVKKTRSKAGLRSNGVSGRSSRRRRRKVEKVERAKAKLEKAKGKTTGGLRTEAPVPGIGGGTRRTGGRVPARGAGTLGKEEP